MLFGPVIRRACSSNFRKVHLSHKSSQFLTNGKQLLLLGENHCNSMASIAYSSLSATDSFHMGALEQDLEQATEMLLDQKRNPLGTMSEDNWEDALVAMECWKQADPNGTLSGYSIDSFDRLLQRLVSEYATETLISQNRRESIIIQQITVLQAWLNLAQRHTPNMNYLAIEKAEIALFRLIDRYNRGWTDKNIVNEGSLAVINSWLSFESSEATIRASKLLLSWTDPELKIVTDDVKREVALLFQQALDQSIALNDGIDTAQSLIFQMDKLKKRHGWEELEITNEIRQKILEEEVRSSIRFETTGGNEKVQADHEIEVRRKKTIEWISMAGEDDKEMVKSLSEYQKNSLESDRRFAKVLTDYYVKIKDARMSTQWLKRLDVITNTETVDEQYKSSLSNLCHKIVQLWRYETDRESPWRVMEIVDRMESLERDMEGVGSLDSSTYNLLCEMWLQMGGSVANRKVQEIFWKTYNPNDKWHVTPNIKSLILFLRALSLGSGDVIKLDESQIKFCITILNKNLQNGEVHELENAIERLMELLAVQKMPTLAKILLDMSISRGLQLTDTSCQHLLQVYSGSVESKNLITLMNAIERESSKSLNFECFKIAINNTLTTKPYKVNEVMDLLIRTLSRFADGKMVAEPEEVGSLLENVIINSPGLKMAKDVNNILQFAEDELLPLLEEHTKRKSPIPISCFNHLMKQRNANGLYFMAEKIYERLLNHYHNGYFDLIPNTDTYNILMKSFTQKNDIIGGEKLISGANDLFESTSNDICKPNNRSLFMALFLMYLRVGTEDALTRCYALIDRWILLDEFNSGKQIGFDTTMKLILKIDKNMSSYEEVSRLYYRLREKGQQPDLNIMHTMLEACAFSPPHKRKDALRTAVEVLAEIRNRGLMNEDTYYIFIEFLKKGPIKKIEERVQIARAVFQACCEDRLLNQNLMGLFRSIFRSQKSLKPIMKGDQEHPGEWSQNT